MTAPKTTLIRRRYVGATALCSVATAVSRVLAADAVDLQTSPNSAFDIQEIVVTATRRDAKLLEIPYNISAITGDALENLGIRDITQLSQAIPGLNYPNQGAGRDDFTVPIIRGVNLSSATIQFFPHGEVAPVSTYIGDTPVSGRFPVNDLERVEVLRGPQGTLYGAGSIAGTIRLIPADPKIGEFSGNFESSVSTVDYSHEPSYGFNGVVNLPVNDQVAFRVSGVYQRDAGYIDAINLVRRDTSSPVSPPLLAVPGDVAGSGTIRYSAKAVNWSESVGGRAAALFEPAASVQLVLSLQYVHERGGDNNGVSNSFQGGPDTIDPRVMIPAPGPYQQLQYALEPYKHDAALPTLDGHFDLGFATLSSNTSYFDSHGSSVADETYLDALFNPAITAYYTGTPVFPRFTSPDLVSTDSRDVSEEVRLVSNGQSTVDYVVGGFFQHHQDGYSTSSYTPGADAWDAATPAPILPIIVFANDQSFLENTHRNMLDRSIYGEITYHVTPTWQMTAGGRAFWEASTTTSQVASSAFAINVVDNNKFSGRGQLGKLNTSWDYVIDHRLYVTFSQGYRPGGANGVPLNGGLAELPALATFGPDHVNNYEAGGKGRFGPMLSYTVDVFDMELKRAQLNTATPYGFPVVVNTAGARSRGAEFEMNGLLIDHISYRAGYSYADAKLTHAFEVTTASGLPIGGDAGARLPGSAPSSWSGSLTYNLSLAGFALANTVGIAHKGTVANSLPSSAQYLSLPGYTLTNLNINLSQNRWHVTVFVNNVTNERAFTAGDGPRAGVGPQGALAFVETPREIGARFGVDF